MSADRRSTAGSQRSGGHHLAELNKELQEDEDRSKGSQEEFCDSQEFACHQDMKDLAATMGKLTSTLEGMQIRTPEPSLAPLPGEAIRAFSGMNDEYSVNEFIQIFALHARALKLDDDSKARQLPLFLTEYAFEEYGHLPSETQNNFQAVCHWLRAEFSKPQAKMVASAKLKNRTIRAGESPWAYARAMMKLARLAYPRTTYKDLQAILLADYIMGLPESLREQLFEFDLHGVDQAAAMADRLIAKWKMYRILKPRYPNVARDERRRHERQEDYSPDGRKKHKKSNRRGSRHDSSDSSSSSGTDCSLRSCERCDSMER